MSVTIITSCCYLHILHGLFDYINKSSYKNRCDPTLTPSVSLCKRFWMNPRKKSALVLTSTPGPECFSFLPLPCCNSLSTHSYLGLNWTAWPALAFGCVCALRTGRVLFVFLASWTFLAHLQVLSCSTMVSNVLLTL